MNYQAIYEEMDRQCQQRGELIREMSLARIKRILTTGTPKQIWKCLRRWERMLAKSSKSINFGAL